TPDLTEAAKACQPPVTSPVLQVQSMSSQNMIPLGGTPLTQALRITQENLVALQKLGEQTAQLHRQFLDGQDATLHALQALMEQQQRLIQASLDGSLPAPSPRAIPAPAPVALSTNGSAPKALITPVSPSMRDIMPAVAPVTM